MMRLSICLSYPQLRYWVVRSTSTAITANCLETFETGRQFRGPLAHTSFQVADTECRQNQQA
jgi:hypothetical protein